MVEHMREIVFKYTVPLEFMYRLSSDSECISYSSPIEMAVCEKTF